MTAGTQKYVASRLARLLPVTTAASRYTLQYLLIPSLMNVSPYEVPHEAMWWARETGAAEMA